MESPSEVKSSIDPNNNRIPDEQSADRVVSLSARPTVDDVHTDQLVEAINGRLLVGLQENHNDKSRNNKSIGSDQGSDLSYEDAQEEEEEDNDKSVFSDELGDEEEEESEVTAAIKEPYDVDTVLISTFLEHTTSIVRTFDILISIIKSPLVNVKMSYIYHCCWCSSPLQAEARLAARRQARAEAREIRMKELERQQKEQEQNADRVFDMQSEQGIAPRTTRYTLSPAVNTVARNNVISRRSSEDSVEEEGRNHRDIRFELKVRKGSL